MAHFSFIKNVYIRDSQKKFINCIFLEFAFDDNSSYKLLYRLQKSPLFREVIEERERTIYVFKFPKEFLKEYRLFKRSKYSEFGEDAKVYIMEFWRGFYRTNKMRAFYTKLKGILYREKRLKNELEKLLQVSIHEKAELGELIKETDEIIELK